MPKTVNLTWNNASSGITEQLVERSVTDGAFVQIGTTPPNQNSFTDNVDEFVGETKLSYKVSSNYIHEGTSHKASSSIFDIVINQSTTSNEMEFSTTNGSLSYVGTQGDQILLSDGTTVDIVVTDESVSFTAPAGKHKVKLVESADRSNYVSVGGEALVELHNFPTLSTIGRFDFYPNSSSSPNLVKVPTVLPSNLTSITWMFCEATSFNQDISMWDVSKVMYMVSMFEGAEAFNQDLSQWCVSNITSKPNSFAEGAPLFTEDKHPVWGTCPRGENAQP